MLFAKTSRICTWLFIRQQAGLYCCTLASKWWSGKTFCHFKISWIRKHQRNFEAQDRQAPRQYKERESHYFLGKRYLLRITENDAPAKVELKTKTYIDLLVRPNTTTEQKQTILNEWYRTELKKLVQPLIDKWQQQIGVTVADWQVKQMKPNGEPATLRKTNLDKPWISKKADSLFGIYYRSRTHSPIGKTSQRQISFTNGKAYAPMEIL